ncbi:hypothetical protein T439DRAFT_377090 [Meredithblackwellia eburnea MCA 4105]
MSEHKGKSVLLSREASLWLASLPPPPRSSVASLRPRGAKDVSLVEEYYVLVQTIEILGKAHRCLTANPPISDDKSPLWTAMYAARLAFSSSDPSVLDMPKLVRLYATLNLPPLTEGAGAGGGGPPATATPHQLDKLSSRSQSRMYKSAMAAARDKVLPLGGKENPSYSDYCKAIDTMEAMGSWFRDELTKGGKDVDPAGLIDEMFTNIYSGLNVPTAAPPSFPPSAGSSSK